MNDKNKKVADFWEGLPDFLMPLIDQAKENIGVIENFLYTSPTFIAMVAEKVPESDYRLIFTNEQKKQIRKGLIELIVDANGNTRATLRDKSSKKILTNVPVEEFLDTTNIKNNMIYLSMQLQMAQISEQISSISEGIKSIKQGQENDRLAKAYALEQAFYQACQLKNTDYRSYALLNICQNAEEARNLLILSQKENIRVINEHPESNLKKLLSKDKNSEIKTAVSELGQSLAAINRISLIQSMAYYQLEEYDAANLSFKYYADFIKESYLNSGTFIMRLSGLDPNENNTWIKDFKELEKNINLLSVYKTKELGTYEK